MAVVVRIRRVLRASERGRRPGHAFSGPRSRSTTEGRERSPHQHRGAAPPEVRPRMGPAPARPNHLPGDSEASRRSSVPPISRVPPAPPAGRRWRLWAQDPFAVAPRVARHLGLDEAARRSARWSTASVGRRTQATPAA